MEETKVYIGLFVLTSCKKNKIDLDDLGLH